MGGATGPDNQPPGDDGISIHAPRGGSDRRSSGPSRQHAEFQSTLPVGGATIWTSTARPTPGFQSTLPVGGATTRSRGARRPEDISIHAPRGGSDMDIFFCPKSVLKISIHAPRGGSDSFAPERYQRYSNFNPRSPWGERHFSTDFPFWSDGFQSTLPVGGATSITGSDRFSTSFQSTLPVGGATYFGIGFLLLDIFQSTLPVGGAT